MRQYNGIVYAVRRNSTRMRRIEGTRVLDAGRPAGETFVTNGGVLSASASGGSLAGGTYQLSYGLYDSVSGYSGNEGPALAVVVPAGTTGSITIAPGAFGLVPSDDTANTHYKVYMSRVGGSARYLVATIQIGQQGSLVITTEPTSSEQAPTRQAQPDPDATCFEVWGERGWISNGTYLKYSDFRKLEGYSNLQNLDFNPNDNDNITTLKGWHKRFVIAKRRAIILLTGIDRQSFEQELWTDRAGCIAPHSMQDCEGLLVWLGEDGFMAARAGEEPKNISDSRVRKVLGSMTASTRETASACVLPGVNIYVVTFRAVIEGVERTWMLAYNWDKDAWAEIAWPFYPTFVTTGFGPDLKTVVFGLDSSRYKVWKLFSGSTDSGSAIRADWTTAAPDVADRPSQLIGFSRLHLLTSKTRWPLTIQAYEPSHIDTSFGGNDGTAQPLHERVVNLRGSDGWKDIAFYTGDKMRSQLQLKISYEGLDSFWVSDMAWDLVLKNATRRVW
jgi:hypothetical protein